MSNENSKADVVLTSREQDLRLVVDTIPALVWRAVPDGNIEYVNKRVLEYFGVPLGEIIGSGWRDRVHPDDVAFKVSTWLENLESASPHRAVCRLRGADGRYRWFEVRGEPLRAGDGAVKSWYGVLNDIEDQKKAEAALRDSDVMERKRAAEALRESEHKLRQIIDTVPSLLWSADPVGEPTYVNQHTLDYSGMQLEDFKQGGWEAFIHPEDFPETASAFYHALQTGTSYRTVHRLRRADGQFRWHRVLGEPLRDREGRIIHWYGLAIDIDEAKKAEEQLRRSEAYLAEAQRISHTGSWAWDPVARRLLYWSEECYRIWGFDPDQGLPDTEIGGQRIHPDDRDRVNSTAFEARRQKRPYSIEFRLLLPDGTIKYIEGNEHHVFSASGELVEALGTNVDITERKHAEQALRESESKFRDYAETASDWFWEIDPDYKFTLLTENAFGSGVADRIGTVFWDHALDVETEPEKWRLVRATLDARQPFRDFVYCAKGGDGSPLYVRASGKPVLGANGEFRGYRGTGNDVTAINRAQEEHERLRELESHLAQINRVSVMGELAASLAHEITQPIATARNNARAAMNFLDRNPPDLGEVREALASLVGDTDRAGRIIDGVRGHIKRAPRQMDRFDLNDAIKDVIGLARVAIIKNGVAVHAQLTVEPLIVEGDRVQLQQVALNLILNAIEAMSSVERGARDLSISTERSQPNEVRVVVRDFGPGIDPKHLERVFETFYTTKSGGTGMGLSISRSIVTAHGGRLWAELNSPRGALFQFTLPAGEDRGVG